MSENTIILPILGMTCANCSAAVERSIRKEPGVKKVSVNLATEKATVEIDPQTGTDRLIDRVRRAGYDVAIGEAHFLIENLSDNSDALVVEKRIQTLPGILRSQVNVSTSTLRVEFLPTATSQADLQSTLRKMGFKLSEAGTA